MSTKPAAVKSCPVCGRRMRLILDTDGAGVVYVYRCSDPACDHEEPAR